MSCKVNSSVEPKAGLTKRRFQNGTSLAYKLIIVEVRSLLQNIDDLHLSMVVIVDINSYYGRMAERIPNPAFTELQGHINEGQLRLFDIDTIPRSIGSALGRTLASGNEDSIYIHEPFHYIGQTLDDGAGRVLAAVHDRLALGRPLTVITKNYARYLPPPMLAEWRSICNGVVYHVRHPLIQAGSFVTRAVNDQFDAPGANSLFQGQLSGEHLEATTDFVSACDGWQELGAHFEGNYQAERVAIVDGEEFVRSPVNVLRSVCKHLGLNYSPRMVTEWSPNVVNVNTRIWNRQNPAMDRSRHNGWTGRVMSSRSLGPVKRSPLDPSVMPAALIRHLRQDALPVYDAIKAHRRSAPINPRWSRRSDVHRLPRYRKPEPKVQIIERKLSGHPDTFADLLADTMMSRYSAVLAPEVGGAPHGSFDKVVCIGGTAKIGWGYSEVQKNPEVVAIGKAMARNGSVDYLRDILYDTVDSTMRQVYNRSLNGDGAPQVPVDLRLAVNAGTGAEHDPEFYAISGRPVSEQWDHQLSNDTVACAGWYPFTRHEQLTVELGNYISSASFKAEFPEIGADVKIMTHQIGEQTSVTLCLPFIADLTPSATYYEARKLEAQQRLMSFVTQRIGPNVLVNLNTKDVPGRTGYLTVFGTALDKGDNGITGRGNRAPGFISVTRPSAVESPYGKNPFNHSGRLGSAFSFDLARMIYEYSGLPTETFVMFRNGDNLSAPWRISVFQNEHDVTVQYRQHIERAIQLVTLPGYTQDQTALQAFKTCNGLLPKTGNII